MKIRPAGLALVIAAGLAVAASAPGCSDEGGGGTGGDGFAGSGAGGSGGSAAGGSGGVGGSGGSGGTGETGGSGGTGETGGSGGGGSGGTGEVGGSGGGGAGGDGGSGGGSPIVCSDGSGKLAIRITGSGFGKYEGKKLHGAVAEAGSDRNVGKEQSTVITGGRFSLTWPALAAKDKAYHLTWYVGVDNDDDVCDQPPHDESWIFNDYVPTTEDCTHEIVYEPAPDSVCNFF